MSYEQEKMEAINAGYQALSSLQAAQDVLKGARNWGMLDMLGSRSWIVSMIKRNKMQNAQQCMDQARYDLECFSRELSDVSALGESDLVANDFLSFADVFMDNIIVDWMVQSKIQKALQQVNQAIEMVQQTLDRVRRM